MIGATFAARYPDRLDRAVLMNCTASKAGFAQKARYATMLQVAAAPASWWIRARPPPPAPTLRLQPVPADLARRRCAALSATGSRPPIHANEPRDSGGRRRFGSLARSGEPGTRRTRPVPLCPAAITRRGSVRSATHAGSGRRPPRARDARTRSRPPIAVFRLRDGSLQALDASPAPRGRWPTGSPTAASSCARALATPTTCPPAARSPAVAPRSPPIRCTSTPARRVRLCMNGAFPLIGAGCRTSAGRRRRPVAALD